MKQDKTDRTLSLIDSFLKTHHVGDESKDIEIVSSDYMNAYLNSKPDVPDNPTQSVLKSKSEALLDAFLDNSNEKIELTPPKKDDNFSSVEEDGESNNSSNRLNEQSFTQTLARIYLKQHKYDKAMEIIRSLYLNFPNKNIYFADQIRFLEKLIKINQNLK